jgi:hypothetical protein
MTAFVVDTNVPMTANRQASASEECIKVCVEKLLEAREGLIVLDDKFRILREYLRYRSTSAPGAGDDFMEWVLNNRANPERCEIVRLTPKNGSEHDFEEFPADPDLAGFDPSDRKFVAVALASANQPEVLNATDTDWWHFREPLERHGVTIRFLCPSQMPGAGKGNDAGKKRSRKRSRS